MFEWHKKEKPVFTGIARGVGGFGFGSAAAAVGGPSHPGIRQYSVDQYNTSGTGPSITNYTGLTIGDTRKFATAGYYILTVPSASGPIGFDIWVWGAGGSTQVNGPGPRNGGAGGGVRGRYTITSGNTLTFLVADTGIGGAYPAGTRAGGWPDGGTGLSASGYAAGGGGGSSRIGTGTIPFPTINSSPTSYLLIGAGGAAGFAYADSGTLAGQGGYPSGQPGGAYYPADGPSVIGGGASQSSGGSAGTGGRVPGATAGSKYAGGPGYGGGGGGGYYGGGGASGYYGMAGGGSSYIHPSLTNTTSFDATPGVSTHYLSVDDPANPGIKPASGGNSGNGGVVVLKIYS
jgi:hypothetical protein